MRGNREAVSSIRDEDLIEVFSRRLPDLLERRPDLEPTIFAAFLKTFARREEVALVLTELRSFRTEVERRFERMDERIERSEREMQEFRAEVAGRFTEVDSRFDKVDSRFDEVQRAIDRLGSRWGIRNESLFRQTMAAVLEQSSGVAVEQRTIAGEQFDVLIHDHEHVLELEQVDVPAGAHRHVQPAVAARLLYRRLLDRDLVPQRREVGLFLARDRLRADVLSGGAAADVERRQQLLRAHRAVRGDCARGQPRRVGGPMSTPSIST